MYVIQFFISQVYCKIIAGKSPANQTKERLEKKMFTVTVSIDELGKEGVELFCDKLLKIFAEMNHTDFCIEIAEQSVEEVMEEDEQISENGMSAESAEEAYIKAFESFPEEVIEDFSEESITKITQSLKDYWVHVS